MTNFCENNSKTNKMEGPIVQTLFNNESAPKAPRSPTGTVDNEVYFNQENVIDELVKNYYLPMKGKNWYEQTIEDEDNTPPPPKSSQDKDDGFQVVPKKKKKRIFITNFKMTFITCEKCKETFPFTAHQANEYKKKGWAPRKKCRNCKFNV